MSKRRTDSTPDENPPKRRKLSDSVLVEAARNGDTTAVRVGLEKLSPDTDSKTVAFDAVHEACRGNHDECLALLLPYVETTQMGFGMLLSECIHADHTACTEVLLQHWKSVCSNVAFVPHGQEDKKDRACPAMWEDPSVCQVLIDAGADIQTKDDMGRSPLHWSCRSGALAVVKILVEAGAGACGTCNFGNTCLMFAAHHGHTETVRYLVGLKDVDVNHKDEDGFTAVLCAVRQNYSDVVEVLIDAGAGIETKSKYDSSPLLFASSSGHLDIVKMLVEAGARMCVTVNNGITCLMLAANFGHTETVRYLVGLKDVDVNHENENNGSTALHCAVQGGHVDVMRVLLDAGADIETKTSAGDSPLLLAGFYGKLDVAEVLVKAGADVCVTDSKGLTCLMLAANCGHTETVRYLVGLKDVDVNHENEYGATALLCAVQKGLPTVVQVLIDAGADVQTKNTNGELPLHFASFMGELGAVKLLVEAGADVRATQKGDTCLMLASGAGHIDTVRYLVGLPGVEVNTHEEKKGFTALHFAVQEGHADVVQVLIDAGADMEAKNSAGCSALLLAGFHGKLDVIKVLIKAGACVCVTENNGDTCLMLASLYRHTETVRTLLCMPEVDVNHAKYNGSTSLHYAVLKKHTDVVQVLIAAGADVDANNSLGSTPLHCACEVGELDIVQMLLEAGAGVSLVDDKTNTCLIIAAYAGHTETVRYLVGLKDVDVNYRGMTNFTALHVAVHEGHHNVLKVLIDAGADMEVANSRGTLALECACNRGDVVSVKMLVEAGANVHVADTNRASCLMLAVLEGHAETVRYLAGLPQVDVDEVRQGKTALCCALDGGAHADVVQALGATRRMHVSRTACGGCPVVWWGIGGLFLGVYGYFKLARRGV